MRQKSSIARLVTTYYAPVFKIRCSYTLLDVQFASVNSGGMPRPASMSTRFAALPESTAPVIGWGDIDDSCLPSRRAAKFNPSRLTRRAEEGWPIEPQPGHDRQA